MIIDLVQAGLCQIVLFLRNSMTNHVVLFYVSS